MVQISRLLAKAVRTHRLDEAELVCLLESDEAESALVAAADEVRRCYVGDGVHLRALLEFSNICRCHCCYCGLRADNSRLPRYRLQPEEMLSLAAKAASYGYKTVVLQSGEDSFFTAEYLSPIIKRLHEFNLAVTLSLGERPAEDYACWAAAGADRYLLRIETTDEELYARFNLGMSWQRRAECLRSLRRLGYEVGTGCMIGLPGQTLQSLAADLLFFQALDADMVGIGPFLPHPATPMADFPPGSLQLTGRMTALVRLLLPEANIPATTASETLQPGAKLRLLQCGANVFMPNLTDGAARHNYELYPGKAGSADEAGRHADSFSAELASIGRHVASGRGDRKHGDR